MTEKLFEEEAPKNESENISVIEEIINAHIDEEAKSPEYIEYAEQEEEQEEEEGEGEGEEESEGGKLKTVKEREGQNSQNSLKNLIDTDTLIVLVDSIVSRIFFFAFSKFLKRDVTIKDFELTVEETKSLSKLLKVYMKETNINITSGQALALGIFSVYGAKAMIGFSQPKSEEKKTVRQSTNGTGKRGRPRKIKEVEE